MRSEEVPAGVVVSLVGVLEAASVSDGRCVLLLSGAGTHPMQIQYPSTFTNEVMAGVCRRVMVRGTLRHCADGGAALDLIGIVVLAAD